MQQRPPRFLSALNFDASHYSFHLVSDLLFLYAKQNFPFTNEEIDDTDPTDCEESSQELEQDVSTWSREISNLGGLCLRRVEHFGGLPRKLLFKDNFFPFDSWGVYPSSLLESLSVLTQHKS